MNSQRERAALVRVTLDHNCIIDLEENTVAAPALQALMSLHRQGLCSIQVVGVGATELRKDHTYAKSFTEFQHKLAAIALGDVNILKPIAYVGLAFVGWCVVGGESTADLEQGIHAVLFPSIEFSYADYCASHGLDVENSWGTELAKKWRNAKCDVLALWCHIWYKGDIFVTTDRNFYKLTKKPALLALGAGQILYPDEAVQTISAH